MKGYIGGILKSKRSKLLMLMVLILICVGASIVIYNKEKFYSINSPDSIGQPVGLARDNEDIEWEKNIENPGNTDWIPSSENEQFVYDYLKEAYPDKKFTVFKVGQGGQDCNFKVTDTKSRLKFNITYTAEGNIEDYYRVGDYNPDEDNEIKFQLAYEEVIGKLLKEKNIQYDRLGVYTSINSDKYKYVVKYGLDLKDDFVLNIDFCDYVKDDKEFTRKVKEITDLLCKNGFSNLVEIDAYYGGLSIDKSYTVDEMKKHDPRWITIYKEDFSKKQEALESKVVSTGDDNSNDKYIKIKEELSKRYKVLGDNIRATVHRGVNGGISIELEIQREKPFSKEESVGLFVKLRDEIVKKYPETKHIMLRTCRPYDLEIDSLYNFADISYNLIGLGNHYLPLNASKEEIENKIIEFK